jgi:myosin protein heavy chain
MQILDEQCVFPKATDDSFVDLLVKTHHGRHPKFKRDALGSAVQFAIEHYAGEVDYNATQWLEKNKDPLQDDLQACLSASNDKRMLLR